MLETRVRVRPWSERDMRSSLGRATSRVPSSALVTVMGALTSWLSVPLGPLTVTVAPSMSTVTPAGTEMGRRPMRDMAVLSFPLPDVGEDFPTHALLGGLLVGQQ